MYNFFENYPWYLGTFLAVSFSVLLALTGLRLVRSSRNNYKLRANHDIAGFTFGIIGVIYAVLLSFTVVSVQERFNEIQRNLDTEANLLADLFRDSQVFPQETRNHIRKSLGDYTEAMTRHYIIDEDTFVSSPLRQTVADLWNAYYDFKPVTEQEKILYVQSIQKLNDFNHVRLLRLFAGKQSISPMMWALLIFGAILTTTFMYFFYSEHFLPQAIMTAMVAGLISFMLFFIFSMDSAFNGYVRVSTEHFKEIHKLYKQWQA